MDLLCLKCTAHTKCDPFKALSHRGQITEHFCFVLFLFEHTSTEEEGQSTLEMSDFFLPTFQVHTLYFSESLTQIIALHSFF